MIRVERTGFIRRYIANRLRFLADRIHHESAFVLFTAGRMHLEAGKGWVLRDKPGEDIGIKLWYRANEYDGTVWVERDGKLTEVGESMYMTNGFSPLGHVEGELEIDWRQRVWR